MYIIIYFDDRTRI